MAEDGEYDGPVGYDGQPWTPPTRWQRFRAGLIFFGVIGGALAIWAIIASLLSTQPRGTVEGCLVEEITVDRFRYEISQVVHSSCGTWSVSDHLDDQILVGRTYDFVLVGTADGRIDQATLVD